MHMRFEEGLQRTVLVAASQAQSPLLASSNSDSHCTCILASLTLWWRFTFPGKLSEQLESSLRIAEATHCRRVKESPARGRSFLCFSRVPVQFDPPVTMSFLLPCK